MEELRNYTWHGVLASHLSADLWSFLLRWIGPTLYLRRTKMGQNIEGNGFELWRKLFLEYEGSDKLMQIAGRSKLQEFPACTNVRHLNQHVDDWMHLFYTYGDGISQDHAKLMFTRTLPPSIRSEIYRRPEVEAHDLLPLTDWVRHQVLHERAEELVAHHFKSEKVTAVGEVASGAPPEQPTAAFPSAPSRPPREPKKGTRA